MITEDYISFETAKLLKERGFDEPCHAIYHEGEDKIFFGMDEDSYLNSILNADCYACPTLQMAMKWLREKYKLHIITLPYAPIDRHPYHPGEADFVYIAQLFRGIIPIDEIGRSVIKLTHEEACEAAIKYCLENLLKKNDEDKDIKKPFFIITNTKTGKCFRAEKCCADLVGHTITITPQNIDDTVVVVGKPCFNDVMTKKECIGDNEKLHIQVFDKDGVMQYEYFMYNVWVRSVDADVNEVVLSFDHMA